MSVNIYDKEKGELIKIAGNANGVIDDTKVSNKTTYRVKSTKNARHLHHSFYIFIKLFLFIRLYKNNEYL